MLTAEGSYHQRDSLNLYMFLTKEHSQKGSDACINCSFINLVFTVHCKFVSCHRSTRDYYVHLIGNHGVLSDYAERGH